MSSDWSSLLMRSLLGMPAAPNQRIAIRHNMPPMTSKETPSYLAHHLALAGRSDTLFTGVAPTELPAPAQVREVGDAADGHGQVVDRVTDHLAPAGPLQFWSAARARSTSRAGPAPVGGAQPIVGQLLRPRPPPQGGLSWLPAPAG